MPPVADQSGCSIAELKTISASPLHQKQDWVSTREYPCGTPGTSPEYP